MNHCSFLDLTCLFVEMICRDDSAALVTTGPEALVIVALLSGVLARLEDFRTYIFCMLVAVCKVADCSSVLGGVLEE